MKKIITFFASAILAASLLAQAPEKLSYQAVIRNSSNVLVTSTTVGIKVSILQGTSTGTPVYIETQTPTTNANGLISIEIGGGTVVSGTFEAINWAADKYFIKTETDPTGGTSYTITGTSQLLSTPYALFSKTAGTLTPNTTSSPIIQLFPSGISNPDRMIIGHSPLFPTWGLQYQDTPDKMNFLSGGANVMTVDLGNQKVGIGTATPAATFTVGTGDKFQVSGADGDVKFTDDQASITFPISDATNAPMIQLFPSGTSNADRMIVAHSPGYLNWGIQYQDASDKVNFIGNGANAVTVDLTNLRLGVGTSTPATKLDILGGNWDLTNTEGDMKIGNATYRLKMGIALGGGGAGDAGVMQQGMVGGYNVLSLGSQGTKILFVNGTSKAVGIGTDDPKGALDVSSTTKGFLPPRMTQAQRDLLTAVEGLMIYNTTSKKPNYYDGTGWKNFDGTAAN
jgi:hypothetical protein